MTKRIIAVVALSSLALAGPAMAGPKQDAYIKKLQKAIANRNATIQTQRATIFGLRVQVADQQKTIDALKAKTCPTLADYVGKIEPAATAELLTALVVRVNTFSAFGWSAKKKSHHGRTTWVFTNKAGK